MSTDATPSDRPARRVSRGRRHTDALGDARYRSLFLEHPDIVYELDLHGHIVACNPSLERMTRLRAQQLVGQHYATLIVAEHREAVAAEFARAVAGEPRRYVTTGRNPTGETVHLQVTNVPIVLDEQVVGVFGIARDIGPQRRAQAALEASEHRFRAIAELANDAIFVVRMTPSPHIEYANPAAIQLTGYDDAQLRQLPGLLGSRLSDDDRRRLQRLVAGEEQHDAALEVRFRRPDGDERDLSIRVTPRREPDGAVVALHAVAVDVTARRRTERALEMALEHERRAAHELRELDEVRAGFLQAVSHEVRTPLTAIVGFASTLRARQDQLRGDERAELLGRLERAATRLRRLIDDLLAVDRAHRRPDELRLEREPVELADLVAATADEVEAIRDGRITRTLTPVTVLADPVLLGRVVDNLLTNALVHGSEEVEVTVGPGPVLVVRDHGPGIPSSLREDVFEPFVQGPAQRHAARPGTGIGLALVRRIVAVHDGSVHLDDAPGGGARFTVTLPTATTTAPDHRAADEQHTHRPEPA